MFGEVYNSCFLIGFSVFVISLLTSLLFIPLVWKISINNGFIALPNSRSSHNEIVPNTGGILLFFAILIPYLLFSKISFNNNFFLVLLSFLSLFIVGVLDDIKNVNVKFKLIGQFIPALFLIFSLHDQNLVIPFVSWSEEIPRLLKLVFWILVIVGIVNAYNFIDGIDGLAIGMGALGGILFGVYFYTTGYCNLSILALCLSGGLIGLLKQNISKRRKIFIGDTGSLIIGGIISLLILRHLEINARTDLNFSSSMIFGILFIPVSDLIRVVIMRLINGNSPFKADRTHIHHIIMDSYKLNHIQTSLILVATQLVIFFIFLGYNKIFEKGQLIFSLFMFGLYFIYLARTEKSIAKARYSS